MAKKNRKNTKSAISDPKPEISECEIIADKTEADPDSENTASACESEDDKDITVSGETLAEIGAPDKELVFRKVAKAYEEAKHKREKYKKAGPVFVFVSGVAFLTLIFTLENKITFLILWVITILFTVALMVRAEYKYHQFRCYLGLTDEDEQTDAQNRDEYENAEQEEKP